MKIVTKILFIFSVITTIMVGSGCGASGDLYLPSEPQSAEK